MANPKITGAQRDFSAGELDEALKRADEQALMKTGARQLSNFRILQGGQAQNRPGRSALFLEAGRVEQVLMGPANIFYLAFGDGYLRVYNAAGAIVASTHVKGDGVTALPWRAATANTIIFTIVPGLAPQVYITYPHDFPVNIPQVLTWDGVSQTSNWTLTNYTVAVMGTGQVRTIFDRISQQNVTILPSATVGVITMIASAPVFNVNMVNCHLLWCGRQVLLTGYVSATEMIAQVIEQLPNSVQILLGQFLDVGNGNEEFLPGQNGYFLPGDLIEGATSGAHAIVLSTGSTIGIAGTAQNLFYAPVPYVIAQIIPTSTQQAPPPFFLAGTIGVTSYFTWQENVIGPNGNGQVGATGLMNPGAVSIWDDEVMNDYRGWPTSCFYDQNRLGFCGFAVAKDSIAWSSIGLPTDLYVNGLATTINADNAIFEQVPGANSVQFVTPGMESAEFIFCDNAIFYIPIGGLGGQPLTPGTVSFNKLSDQGSQPNVQPRPMQQSILFLRAGGASMGAVQTTGYYARPHIVDSVSSLHSHLFIAAPVIALAVSVAPSAFEENYAYALRADGVVLCSRFEIKNGLIDAGQDGKPKMGWVPWVGNGVVSWVSGASSDIIFTSAYAVTSNPWSSDWSTDFGGGFITSVSIVERLDTTQYVDAGIYVNNLPTPFAPPGGKGPLWFIAGQTVQLMDQSTLALNIYQIDANGNIIPQFTAAENLTSPQLVAGQPWTCLLEPFVPDAQPGQDSDQRMNKRRVSRMTTYVSNSTGFVMGRLFSGPLTPASPPLGILMNFYRIPMWNQGDISTKPPPLREQAYRWRPLGRSFDPRVVVYKDSPGPLLVHEIGMEISV